MIQIATVILAANVLTVDAGTVLLIDEPERHLHRSIIEPYPGASNVLENAKILDSVTFRNFRLSLADDVSEAEGFRMTW